MRWKRPKFSPIRSARALLKPVAILCGSVFVLASAIQWAQGAWLYKNYQGLVVFTPFALIIGLVSLWFFLKERD